MPALRRSCSGVSVEDGSETSISETSEHLVNGNKRQRLSHESAQSEDADNFWMLSAPGAPHSMTTNPSSQLPHLPGQIVRVSLKNFVTYDSVTFTPGPALNMIIGPNGTGKSTLVCALCLGLNWSPNLLGRAKEVSEFVKHGCAEAKVEIELKGHDGKRNLLIRREIQREGNKSTWHLNGDRSKPTEVSQKVRSFDIQIDNLCHFLPQDRVVEFSQLSAVDRLTSTQRAAAQPQLQEWHDQLKHLRKQQCHEESRQRETRRNLTSLETKQNNQRPDVERFEERRTLAHSVENLKKVRPWAQYTALTVKYADLRRHRDQTDAELRELRNQVNPALEAVKQKREYAKDVLEVSKKRKRVEDRAMQHVTENKKRQDEVDKKIARTSNDREKQKTDRKHAQDAITAEQHSIHKIKQAMEQAPPEFDMAAINEKVRDLSRQMNEVQSDIEERLTSIKDYVGEVNDRKQKLNRVEHRIRQLSSQAGQRLEKLGQMSPQTAKAWRWVQENRQHFKGEVYGPPVVECTIKDQRVVNMVESLIQRGTRLAITCTRPEDFKFLSTQFSQRLNLHDVFLRTSPQPLEHPFYRPPMAKDELTRLGLEAYALDFIEGPDPVRVTMCNDENLHATGIALRELDESQFQTLQRSSMTRWVTPKSSYQVRRRAEYGSSATSTRVTDVQPARDWNTQDVDTSAETSLREEVAGYQSEIEEFEHQRTVLKEKNEDLKRRKDAIDREKRDLQDEKSEKQAALSKFNGLPNRLANAEEKLQGYREEEQTCQASFDRCNQEETKLILERADLAKTICQFLGNCRHLHEEYVLSQIALLEAQSDVAHLEEENSEIMRRLQEKDQERRDAVQAVNKARGEAQRLGARIGELNAESPSLSEFFNGLDERLKKPEELETEIESQTARLDVMQEDNPNILRDFEKRAREIEKMQQELAQKDGSMAALIEQIREIREKWEPELDELVKKISHEFGASFNRIGCAGEVCVYKAGSSNSAGNDYNEPRQQRAQRQQQSDETAGLPEIDGTDFENWAIHILVKFREAEKMSLLDAHRQSGGERAVSTIFYLMALQSLSRAPFRVVDEINQGMDPRNERMVHKRMVELACGGGMLSTDADGNGEGSRRSSQYFLITPKLLQGLEYAENMTVHCIVSGEYMPETEKDPKALDLGDIAKKALVRRSAGGSGANGVRMDGGGRASSSRPVAVA